MTKRDLSSVLNIGLLTVALIILSYSLSLVAQPRVQKRNFLDAKKIKETLKKELDTLQVNPQFIVKSMQELERGIPILTKQADTFLMSKAQLIKQGAALTTYLKNLYDASQTVLQYADSDMIAQVLQEKSAIKTIPNVAQSSAQVAHNNLNDVVVLISNLPINRMAGALKEYVVWFKQLINNTGSVIKQAGNQWQTIGAKQNTLDVLAQLLTSLQTLQPLPDKLSKSVGTRMQLIKEKITDQVRSNASELERASTLINERVQQWNTSVEQSASAIKQLAEQEKTIKASIEKLKEFDEYVVSQLQAKRIQKDIEKEIRVLLDEQLIRLKPFITQTVSFIAGEVERISSLMTTQEIQNIINALNLQKIVAPELQELLRNLDVAFNDLKKTSSAISSTISNSTV